MIFYTALPDDEVELLARVAGADGIVDKAAAPIRAVRGDPARRARGARRCRRCRARSSTPRRTACEPDDLALLAMLMDRTSPADVAAALHMDRRRVAKRTERVLGRLRRRPAPRAAA